MTKENQDTIAPAQSFFHAKKNWIVGILVATWICSVIFSFWWFQFRNVQAFDINAVENRTIFFEGGRLGDRLEKLVQENDRFAKKSAAISVVHFWNPDCPCSRFNQPHVQQIMSDYGKNNVQFTVVVSGATEKIRQQRQIEARKIFNAKAFVDIRSDWPMENGPPSSPAVGVISSSGELVYFGPYSLGARCSPEKGKFVEKVIDELKSKNQSVKKQLNTLAVGCFCPWAS